MITSVSPSTRYLRYSSLRVPGCVLLLGATVAILCGCASGPPLPKRAGMQTGGGSASSVDFSETVADADVIYFPLERAASGARSEPAGLLIDAFQNSGASFAIGWGLIDAREQPVLDQLSSQSSVSRERLVARLDLAGSGRAREHCRSVLNDPRFAAVHQIALKLPDASSETMPAAGGSASEAHPRVAMHFRQPPGGLETFAERMSAAESLSGRDVASEYRAHVAAQQFAAEQIVRHFQGVAGGKLLVFLRLADLESGRGVPFYVAQKLSLRQVVLGPNADQSGARKLWTGRLRVGRSHIQIVDSPPITARD
ncbi:MAG: hypothetical protein H0X73_13105 [Chthoniobacterales bacterium]|nr:hypothetical protein [Chthoniobacterales bacterium]